MTSLSQWRSHKVVSAGKILEPIDTAAPGTEVVVVIEGATGAPTIKRVDRKVFSRDYPQVGDYLVVYAPDEKSPDGYVSWSPGKAFEDGYSRLIGREGQG